MRKLLSRQNREGSNALHIAANKGQTVIVKMLTNVPRADDIDALTMDNPELIHFIRVRKKIVNICKISI